MDAEKTRASMPTLEEIEAYFAAHPTLLADHPRLLESQRPALGGGETVVDLQQHLLRRMRQEMEALKSGYEELVHSCRDNLSSQVQIHQAILDILATAGLDELMEMLTVDLLRLFDVDVSRLCLEADLGPETDAVIEENPLYDIVFLKSGEVRRLMGEADVRLIDDRELLGELLGGREGLAASAALLRLRLDAVDREGILIFGSRFADRYAPGQGVELLAFLAGIVELRLGACLSATLS